MKSDESFDNSTCAEQIQLAERELASFIGAVKELFGPEQACLSADDWLEEFELIESPSRYSSRDSRGCGKTGRSADRRAASSNVAGRTGRYAVSAIPWSKLFVLHASDGMRLIIQGTRRK
jgi:hypothetical protein